MNELDRAKEFEQAWERQGLSHNSGPDAGDAVLLSHRGQILADLIALCERQQAELGALRVLRDVHAPAASDEPGDDGVVVEWDDRGVSGGDTGDDDD